MARRKVGNKAGASEWALPNGCSVIASRPNFFADSEEAIQARSARLEELGYDCEITLSSEEADEAALPGRFIDVVFVEWTKKPAAEGK